MNKREEQVLCIRRVDAPPLWLPQEGAVTITENDLNAALSPLQPVWLPRSVAETDPTHKQLIPYCIVTNAMGEIACYPRGGSEKRLHAFWSVGVGGHINPVDTPSGLDFWKEVFRNGLKRELDEEFPSASEGKTRFIGIINEDVTPVGTVHLGLVFYQSTALLADAIPGEELEGLQWVSPFQMGRSEWPMQKFEKWSCLACQLFTLSGSSPTEVSGVRPHP